MVVDLNNSALMCAAPQFVTDFVNVTRKRKSTHQALSSQSQSTANTQLAATRTAMLLSPLALAACGGGEEDSDAGNSSESGAGAPGTSLAPVVSVLYQSLFSVQAIGESAEVIDLDRDGNLEVVFFPASTRSPNMPDQNPIAIIEINRDGSIVANYEIEYFFDGFDASKIVFQNKSLNEIRGAFTSGWVQDTKVVDFDGDGLPDLFFSGHGRELSDGETNFVNTNPEMWPGEAIKIAFSGSSQINTITVSEDEAFWHGADAGDIDGDGDQDIVGVISSGPNVGYSARVWLNDGSGNFTAINLPDEIELRPSEYFNIYRNTEYFVSSVVAIGNIVEGPAEELIFARIESHNNETPELMQIYGWRGSGVELLYRYETSLGNLTDVTGVDYDKFSLHADKITMADIDGDGDDDIALKLLYNSSYLTTLILENQGGGEFKEHFVATELSRTEFGFPGGDGPTLIDINSDGLLDVVNAGWIGNTYWPDFIDNVWINTGDFIFKNSSDFIDPGSVKDRVNPITTGNVQFNVAPYGDGALFIVRGGHVYDDDLRANLNEIRLITLDNLPLFASSDIV